MATQGNSDEMKRLQSQVEALTRALDAAHAETGEGLLPQTEYPRMPSRTSFADTPAANKVAAQNVGLQAMSAPPAAPPAQSTAQTQPAAPAAGGGAFNVAPAPPDLAALDEAYRRQGMGG